MSYTPPTSEIDFELKHRIVGALILIVFGVVVVPMVLSGPNSASESNTADASNADTKVFISKITPIGNADSVTGREAQEPRGTTGPKGVASKPVSKSPSVTTISREGKKGPTKHAPGKAQNKIAAKDKKVGRKEPKTTAIQNTKKSATAATTSVTSIERGWIVRIGTFSKPENATRIMKILSSYGFKPSSVITKTSRGVATRVWVGPYEQRVDAARERSRIQQVTGEKGLIAAYP